VATEKRERFFRQERGDLSEEVGAVDELDVPLRAEIDGFLRESAGGDQHASPTLAEAIAPAQLASCLMPTR